MRMLLRLLAKGSTYLATPMMKHYFNLQKTILERHLLANGVRPWVGYVIGPILFVGLCLLLLERTDYAAYAIALFGVSLAIRLSESLRNTAERFLGAGAGAVFGCRSTGVFANQCAERAGFSHSIFKTSVGVHFGLSQELAFAIGRCLLADDGAACR